MIKLAIGGFRGRMGQRLIALADRDPRFELSARFDIEHTEPDHEFDVLIDFSSPSGTLSFLERCTTRNAALVTGTTGFDNQQVKTLENAATRIALLRAANFSLGVNLLLEILPELAAKLARNFDIEIIETHHTRKVDAPSGTALALLERTLAATGRNKEDHVIYGRAGEVGPKDREQIAVHAVRSGDVVGRHAVIFGGTGESITLTHEAHSRDTFAKGALEAAAWIAGKPEGLYRMKDVLNS